MSTTEPSTKVKFTNQDGTVETFWAYPLGNNYYRIDNTPWLAYGVSWHDVIEARWTEAEDFPEFVRVINKSGYRTIRLILEPPANESPFSRAILDKLRDMGCSYEGANSGLFAVDIPPVVDLMAVRDYLISTNQQWEHADPTYDELFSNDPSASG